MAALTDDLAELKRLRVDYDEKRKASDKAKEDYEKKRLEVYGRMEDERIGSMRVDGVGNFVRNKPDPKPVIQDRGAFLKWAQKNRPGLVQTSEQRKALNEFVRELVDNNEGFPPGLGVRYDEVVSIYKP